MDCPRCKSPCDQDSVDVGVGIIYGPWGCNTCGWSEDARYDSSIGGGVQADGSYVDPQGSLWPAGNLLAKAMKRANEENQ